MEELFKKIPSLIKPKKSSSSSSRSTTPTPPLLSPSLPPQDIPIPPILLEINLSPPPPLANAVDSSDNPLPSTSPPPPALTQGAVIQRDQAAKVFESSPLTRQPITSVQLQQQQERIERQRARYRPREELTIARRKVPSQSSSANGDKKLRKKGKKKNQDFTPSLPLDIPSTVEVKKQRLGPATTFDEILGVDGSAGAVIDLVSFPKIPDDIAPSFSGPPTPPSATTPAMNYIEKRPGISAINNFPKLVGLDLIDGSNIAANIPQPLSRNESSESLLFAAAEIGTSSGDDSNEADTLKLTEMVETYSEDSRKNLRAIHRQKEIGSEPSIVNSNQSQNTKGPNKLPLRPSTSPKIDTDDSIPEKISSRNSLENEPSIPQLDGNAPSRSQDQNEPPIAHTDSFTRPDPFGIQDSTPTQSAIRLAEQGRQVPFLRRLKNYFTSEAKSIGTRTVQAFTRGPQFHKDINTDMVHLEEFDEVGEDLGTRKAKAVVRSWSRSDLVSCYVLLTFLTAYFGLGSLHSVLIITQAVNDYAMRAEVKLYQFELALSMLGVIRILGIMTFAKLTNAYSRPCALFVAVLFAVGGVGTSAFAVTWEVFSAGHSLFHFGRSGALAVAQVIVADISDLGWRGIFTWGLEIGFIFWTWTELFVEKLVQKLGWHISTWIFFSFTFPVAVPILIATYVFHRRASHWGFFPAARNIHRRAWWTPKGSWNRMKLFSVEYDCLGIFLWIIGVGSLTTVLSVAEKMQAGIGVWMMALLLGGSLSIILLIIWELWLNNGLRKASKLERQESRFEAHAQQHGRATGVSWGALPNDRVMIPGPAGDDSVSINQGAAQLSARIMESQKPGELTRWSASFGAYREKSHPLFRTRLLKRRTIPLGCLIGFLANFATRIGVWSVWDRPENLPDGYEKFIDLIQGEHWLENVQFTSLMIAGLLVGFLIRITKMFKWFVISGLLLMLSGLLIFHSTGIYFISQIRIVVIQTITGFGAGMVWIGLMVGVQASCEKHSDVATSIGLLTTFNAVGEMTAQAMKRLMQTYFLTLLPAGSSQDDFVRALNGHWGVMLLVAVAATAFALVMAGVGLASYNIDKAEQHISGVVFGMDDTERQKGDEEHPSGGTPSPFILSPEDANFHPQGPPSLPPGTNLDSIQATTEYGTAYLPSPDQQQKDVSPQTSESSETTSFFPSQPRNSLIGFQGTKDSTANRTHASTAGWETTSESIISKSHTTSDSQIITSPARVLSSYMDGIFTMDSDIEQTPRAVSRAFNPYEDICENLAISPQTNTIVRKEPSTIRRRNSRSQPAAKTNVLVESNIASAREEFSFKKRQIGTTKVPQAKLEKTKMEEKYVWSDSSSGEECLSSASISGFSGHSGQLSTEILDLIDGIESSVEWEVFDQYRHEEHWSSESQPNSSDDIIAIPLASFSCNDLGSDQVSPDLATMEDVAMASGELNRVGRQKVQCAIEDGRVSRLSFRAKTERAEVVDMTSVPSFANTSQLSVGEITSEVDALTEKNSYSSEQVLSPIMELSSQGSLEHVTISLPPDTSNQSSFRAPIVIGLLPPSQYQTREEAPDIGGTPTIVATRAKRTGKGRADGRP